MSAAQPAADLAMRAQELFHEATVWDGVWPVDLKGYDKFGNDWGKLERFAQAGVHVLGVTLAGDNQNLSQAMDLVGWARREVRDRSDSCWLITSVADVQAARQARKLGIVFQFEGTRCFERNLDLLDVYYALGVRQTILAFNNHNSVGGGCAEENDAGLTAFGRRFIREAERVGMMIDLSHTGYRTTLDALAMAQKPMIFSHSNAYAVHAIFRNIRDDQVKACAATGGLVGVSGSSAYLGDPECRAESIFKHLDHYVGLVGPEHVGLGVDVVFDGKAVSDWARRRPDEWPIARDPSWPGFSYAMPEQLVELTAIMLRHGYPDAAIRKILGGNYLRICASVWS